ncbi:MAG: ABC transporter substrate-binding protein, partial [Burkholderiales bacterium]
MNWRGLGVSFVLVGIAFAANPAAAQKAIRIGYPVILSGPGALIGEPSLKGAQMFVEELNAKGGVLGRKVELVVRDTKGNADEAVRIARDLILRENVDFLVGTLTSAEGPAVSPVAKENKIVFVVPVVKTDQLTAPENMHPYVFRTATNTTIEGRTAAELMAKWPVKRVATMSPDYAFGQDLTRAFVAHLKKIRPDIEIVDQQWPKLGEADYTPFINAQLAKKPDAVFTSLWGGHFVTFAKQAKPLRYFEAVKFNVLAAGEAGAIETAKAMGDDYPLGITANAYDAFNWTNGPPQHKEYIARLRAYLKEDNPSSWPITGYIGMQMLTAAIAKAGSTDSDKVAKAML